MKLRNKLILILSLVLLIFLFLEGFFGNLYFEKYFRYSKVLQLEKIDFINGDKVDYDKLKNYEKTQNALVMIYKDDKIVNLENFYYIKVKTKTGDAFVLLDAFLDNLYSNTCKRQEFFVVFLAFSIVVKLAFQNATFLADLITPIH